MNNKTALIKKALGEAKAIHGFFNGSREIQSAQDEYLAIKEISQELLATLTTLKITLNLEDKKHE